MRYTSLLLSLCFAAVLASCSSMRSGGDGITDTEIFTVNESYNRMDLEVDPQGITYTIDISTAEGLTKLNGLSLVEAKKLALEEAAIKNNCARIISPKFSHLKKGKQILRVTVFGFPARYKNAEKPKVPDNNLLIIK
ncbi:MAG: hypothetical protein K2J96_04445 [Bacteroidaceae bacterium]|nr:hypothetical protein [Bacteroidaceae bacterium]